MEILVDAPLPLDQRKRLLTLSPNIELVDSPSSGGPLPRGALRNVEVIYTTNGDFDPADAPRLRWVQLNIAATNRIAGKPMVRSAVRIANVSGAYSTAVAECALGMLPALTRRIALSCALQRDQRWPEDYIPFQGEDLFGRTMGIVGYGSIGRQNGRLAQALGMTVLACKRRPEIRHDKAFRFPGTGDPDGTIPKAWFGTQQIREMFSQSDVATVTLPEVDSAQSLIGARELEALPSHAYLINVGRGRVIDEAALVKRLRTSRFAGAALDVFTSEPLPSESPLWKLPNVLVTPHIGSWTKLQANHASEVLIENFARDLQGEQLINLIDKELMY